MTALAPDQRAVLELVLRQGRSYGELSELLGIPEREVRDRAEGALRSLAGDPAGRDVDTGRIADWLLGQQTERAATATRESVAAAPAARDWAARAAEELRAVGGERVPDVPGEDEGGQTPFTLAAPAAAPRPRPQRDAAAAARPSVPRGAAAGSSRLGGAVLIAVVALAIAAFLFWFLTKDDSGAETASTPAAATATATPTAGSGLATAGTDIALNPVGGGKGEGLMRLFKAEDGNVNFAIGAQNLPNNKKGESYAVWFTRADGAPRLLGFPQAQVTEGVLTVGGPRPGDESKFPRWFAGYDKVLITRETEAKPKEPGAAVLEGTLPSGRAAG
jgi:hypothetical protein